MIIQRDEGLFQEYVNQNMSLIGYIDVYRLDPAMLKGSAIRGFLETYDPACPIHEIVVDIGCSFGGGRFRMDLVAEGRVFDMMYDFDIAGMPILKLPSSAIPCHCSCPARHLFNFGCTCGAFKKQGA